MSVLDCPTDSYKTDLENDLVPVVQVLGVLTTAAGAVMQLHILFDDVRKLDFADGDFDFHEDNLDPQVDLEDHSLQSSLRTSVDLHQIYYGRPL